MSPTAFRVIIVGGGVSGLTLASALEKADVDYVLLESREEFAPFLGASVAINGNGGRILDQLGCYEPIESHTVPLAFTQTWKGGRMVRQSDQFILNHKRLGYPVAFCDRHFLLKTIYNNIKDKSHLLPGRRVTKIEQNHKGTTVICQDGTSYTGDVVIGADGVHSRVRETIFRDMEVNAPHLLNSEDKSAMTSEYKCMFGVSTPLTKQRLDFGLFYQAVGKDLTVLTTLDKDGRVFWFVIEKMDMVHRTPAIPRYTDEDAITLAKKSASVRITDKVDFAELWENRAAYRLVPLEEAFFRHWAYDRLACIGDSVHKWTPNIGQGGNHAIETAATMANVLRRLAHQSHHPSADTIAEALASVQQRRHARAKATFEMSNLITRLEAIKGPREVFLLTRIMPHLGDYIINRVALGLSSAEKLDFLPVPSRLPGTMGFSQEYGPGTTKHLGSRALLALPLFIMAIVARMLFSRIAEQPGFERELVQTLVSGRIQVHGQSWDLPTTLKPFSFYVTVFSPSLLGFDPLQRMQMISFIVDLAPVWLIFVLEAHRRANDFKVTLMFPVLYGIAFQLYGIGVVGPLWFFIHYVESSLVDYAAKDWRLVNVAAAKTAPLAVFMALTLPTFAMYYMPDFDARLTINAIWQAFPIIFIGLHWLLRKYTVKDTTKSDRIFNPQADMPYTRFGVWAFAAISALTYNFVRFTSREPLTTIFLPDWMPLKQTAVSADGSLTLVSGLRLLMQVDEIFCFAAAFLWLTYLFGDLKRADMTSVSWIIFVAFLVAGTYLVGPGAVVILTWWWRENILATKHAKGSTGVAN